MINFKDLNLETKIETVSVKVNNATDLQVRTYLPIIEKAALLEYVVNHAIDQETGRFSPIRVELFYSLAVAHWYADIIFEDDVKALEAYDALETNGIFDAIAGAIPEDEVQFLTDMVDSTVKDIADFNSSLAGIIQTASRDAEGLNGTITDILEKIENKQGIENLSEIKNVVGTD